VQLPPNIRSLLSTSYQPIRCQDGGEEGCCSQILQILANIQNSHWITRLSYNNATIPDTGVLFTSTCQLLLTSTVSTYKHTPQFSLYLALNKDTDPTLHANPSAMSRFQDVILVYSLLCLTLLPSVNRPATLTYSMVQCQSTEVCA